MHGIAYMQLLRCIYGKDIYMDIIWHKENYEIPAVKQKQWP